MNKRLGQHFLKSARALDVIVNALQITEGDTIIEIGPGHGELTKRLCASRAEKIIAIEKDPLLAQFLSTKFSISHFQFSIMKGDALKILPALTDQLTATSYKIVGNIPYYITGYLFRTIGALAHKPSHAVCMIQKEVAERLCAIPSRIHPARSKTRTASATSNGMNRLAASVQIWAEPKIIMALAPDNFDPPPTVDSAIVALSIRNNALSIKELEMYYRMVNILFRQPRKTIMNNLSFGLPYIPKERLPALLAGANINLTARPHHLSVEKIQELSLRILKI